MAEALGLLPTVGYVRVLKLADGDNQTYTMSANESAASNASWTTGTLLVWEWEVTFVSDAGDLPLMAAVWSDGRTLPGSADGFEATGRASRYKCGLCESFPNDSWLSDTEAILGLRMEVRRSLLIINYATKYDWRFTSHYCELDVLC